MSIVFLIMITPFMLFASTQTCSMSDLVAEVKKEKYQHTYAADNIPCSEKASDADASELKDCLVSVYGSEDDGRQELKRNIDAALSYTRLYELSTYFSASMRSQPAYDSRLECENVADMFYEKLNAMSIHKFDQELNARVVVTDNGLSIAHRSSESEEDRCYTMMDELSEYVGKSIGNPYGDKSVRREMVIKAKALQEKVIDECGTMDIEHIRMMKRNVDEEYEKLM